MSSQPLERQSAARSYLILFAPGPQWQSGRPFGQQVAADRHQAYMQQLHAQGAHDRGVPLADGSGSVALLWASSVAQACLLVEADPMVQAGVMIWTLYEQQASSSS